MAAGIQGPGALHIMARNIAPRLTPYEDSRIAQCFLSHPHADHIAEVDEVIKDGDDAPVLCPHFLTCPNDKCEGEEVDFGRIITDDNREIIDRYRASYKDRCPPLQTLSKAVPCGAAEVEYGLYYMRPPEVNKVHPDSDQLYGNGLSLVVYLRHGNQSILIPGDVTPDVLRAIINCGDRIERRYTYFASPKDSDEMHVTTADQPKLRDLLEERGLSVLIAPHHGLESGYCRELFDAMKGGKPAINVISEKRHLSTADGIVDPRYQSKDGAIGVEVDIDGEKDRRYSVSTRDGHHILILFKGTDQKPHVYLRSDPKDLLCIA